MIPPVIRPDDPSRPEVAAVIAAHLAQIRDQTPEDAGFALSAAALKAPGIHFFSLAIEQSVVGIGAIRILSPADGELKSMHIRAAWRGQGLGEAMVRHLVGIARDLGLRRLCLETGAGPAHAPARRLYARAGFADCGPFGDYAADPRSHFMQMTLI